MIPIGSFFLAFLASFGLMEFIGVLVDGFMRPIFRTPGRSAIDAVASFVGSYSIALIITNGVYRAGHHCYWFFDGFCYFPAGCGTYTGADGPMDDLFFLFPCL